MAAQLVTMPLVWIPTGPGKLHEFEAVIGADVFMAYRHRTEFGWSWWEVTRAGSREPAKRVVELPRSVQRWVWVPEVPAARQQAAGGQ